MVVEVVLWGVASKVVTSPEMKPIWDWLGSLAEDVAKDLLKDFIKDDLIRTTWQRLPFSTQGRTLKRCLAAFMEAMKQEITRLNCASDAYVNPLKTFIKEPDGRALLGAAMNLRQTAPEASALEKLWDELGVRSLPDGFDWVAVAMAYRAAVQAIIRDSDELRAIAQFELTEQLLEEQRATADLLADRLGPAVGCDLVTYAEGLRTRYSYLNLTSLDERAHEEDRLRLWSMFVEPSARECRDYLPQQAELPKEWLTLLDERELEHDPQRLERLRQAYLDETPRPVLEWVRSDHPDDRHLVILGDPGAGKSTLLGYLALGWAEKEIFDQGYTRSPAELEAAIVPLVVELQQYANDRRDGLCKTLLDFIETGSFCGHLSRSAVDDRLKDGRAWLFLDGLDEVFEAAERRAMTVEIARLAEQYPQAKIVLTSRVIGYKPYDLRGAEFRHFLLQDLDESQINQFISQWHQLVKRKDAQFLKLRRDRLTQAVRESKQIRELAGNPLLLTMMAILNLHQELPRDRFMLYEQAARVLLHQWDVERALESDPELARAALGLRDKHAMLRRVARVMQDSPEGLHGNLIREEDLEQEFRDYLKTNDRDNAGAIAKRLIRQLRERNFILCLVGPGLYAFVHRTLLEYFCASSFLWDFKETQTLTIETLIAETFGKHWADESWREVLRLIASELDQKFVAQIIEFLLSIEVDRYRFVSASFISSVASGRMFSQDSIYNLILAADCILELRKPKLEQSISLKLLDRLKAKTQEADDERLDRAAAFILLDRIATIWRDSYWIRGWLESLCQAKPFSQLPPSAIAVIAQQWKDDPKTLPWLKDRAQSDENGGVRQAAVQELARVWKDHPDTLPWLKDRAQSDENGGVRQAAVQELIWGWKDHPDTLPWLKDRAQSDEYWAVRQVAVQELARVWKDHPDTLPWLKDRARSDQDWYMRRAAVQALARVWKDHPDTLPWLKDCARSDEDRYVRRAAVQELAQGWKDHPGTFNFLCEVATQDSFQHSGSEYRQNEINPRQTALEKLLEIAPKNPQLIDLLRDRAANDPDDFLREWATEQLAEIDDHSQGI